jgi:cbb3-type cytochrome oxidase maturation protein
MTALYVVLPLALVVACCAVCAFIWTVRSGQLDDVETPPRRILFDDEPADLNASAPPHARSRARARRPRS